MYDEYWMTEAELYFSSCEYQDYYNDWYGEDSYFYTESKRDRRIRDRERMIARGRNIELQRIDWCWDGELHRRERAEMYGRYHYNHLAVCSCDVCGNPRHNGWSKEKDKLTIQEHRANHDEKEQRKEDQYVNDN